MLNGFTLCKQNRVTRSGGGVGIYIRSTFDHVIRNDLQCNSNISEGIFVELECNSTRNILVGCIYRPPDGSILQFTEELESLFGKLRNEKKIVCVGGDFNINLLNYSVDNTLSHFVDLFVSQHFYPTLNRPTRVSDQTNTLIDCIFTSSLGPAVSGVIVDALVSDHFPIILSSGHHVKSNKLPTIRRKITLDATKAFRRRLSTLFRNFNSIDCANRGLNFFCETTELEIDYFYPVCQRNRKVTPLRPWIDGCLLHRINVKNDLYNEYLKNKSHSSHLRFKSLRNQLKMTFVLQN